MGLTKNTATALLALNGRWGRQGTAARPTRTQIVCQIRERRGPSSPVLSRGSSVVRTKRKYPTRREFAYGLAKRVYEFQREIVGRT
jgi:hypothetical protein